MLMTFVVSQIFGDYYHFQHRKVAKRSAEPAWHDDLLHDDPDVSRLIELPRPITYTQCEANPMQ